MPPKDKLKHKSDKHDKPDKPDKPDKHDKPDKPDKHDKAMNDTDYGTDYSTDSIDGTNRSTDCTDGADGADYTDESVDSKGNIRDLIDYTSEDKKPKKVIRKAAIKANKRINRIIKNKESIYKKLTPSKRKYPFKVKNSKSPVKSPEPSEDSELSEPSEDSEPSESSTSEGEVEEEEVQNNFGGIILNLSGMNGTSNPFSKNTSTKYDMKKEPSIIKKFYKLITTPVEENTIDTQITQFKELEHNKQLELITALENRAPCDSGVNLMLKILTLSLPADVKAMILAKYNSLQSLDGSSNEYFKLRSWLEKVVSIPFGVYKDIPVKMEDGNQKCNEFMKNAKKNLDDAIYGQDASKLQIMQFISTKISNPNHNGLNLLLVGPPGIGKCHAKDTPILLLNGDIKMVQDIEVGDILMGDDSRPRNVLSLGSGKDMMYDIIPEKGEKYTVNSEHILCLQRNNEYIEISVKKYLTLTKDEQSSLKGYRTGVEFPYIKPVIDPYISGLVSVSHIPDIYKINNREVRLEVLAGVIDSGGSIVSGKYQLDNTILSNDILYLARSLAFSAYIKNDKIIISGNINEIPVRVRSDIVLKQKKNVLLTGITVKEVGYGEYYGFTLDSNHRYVMGDFTVTHNTSLIKNGIAKALNWPFQFISLGGDSDATTYTGHQLVYESSHCGKIINSIIASKSMSMILMFDEIDKISQTPKGEEIMNMLIHLTDPVQNGEFEDKYLAGIPIDLSKVMFVFSANDITKIDKILLDRMMVIELKGYDLKQKTVIAEKYLLPIAINDVNLHERISISKDILTYIIEEFSGDEKGVRELKRCIEQVTQKINMLRIYNSPELPFHIKDFHLPFIVKKDHINLFLKKKVVDTVPMGMYT